MVTVFRHRFMRVATLVLALSLGTTAAYATHSWSVYHWARVSNPFTLTLGDNVSQTWDAHLGVVSSDWSQSTVLDTVVIPGATKPKVCRASLGRVEVCNAAYGRNGWLGIAQIWLNGTSHITQGVVKVNDTYFSMSQYNTPAWRNLVMCQEVGHTFGLNHQDENFNNAPLGSCMDYSADPTPNQHPNQHDYDQLALIYEHLDSTNTIASSSTASLPSLAAFLGGLGLPEGVASAEWGNAIRWSPNGLPSLYEHDLGNGKRLLTYVFWADIADHRE